MAYGQPKRNATQDANAGLVNRSQATRYKSGTQAEKSIEQDPLSAGVESMGSSLGDAFGSFLTEKAANIKAAQEIKGQVLQGQDKAINSIAEDRKRTGFTEAIFGQDTQYRAAQQQGVRNSILDTYNVMSSEIGDNANLTPEQYERKIQQGMERALQPFDGDEETQDLVIQQWSTSAQKLAKQQRKDHFAYTQQQNRELFGNSVELRFDGLALDATRATSPEEVAELQKEAEDLFTGRTMPEGMSDLAGHSVILEQLNKSLRTGNIGAYNAAKQFGFTKGLSPDDQAALDISIGKYDTQFAQKVATTYELADLKALEAKTLPEAEDIYNELLSNLQTMETRSSGTARAENALVGGRLHGFKTIKGLRDKDARLKAAASKTLAKALEKASSEEVKAARLDAIRTGAATKDPTEKAAIFNQHNPTKGELEDALDANAVADIGNMMGNENITPKEATTNLLGNPQIAAVIARKANRDNIRSPFLKRSLETFINGWQGTLDENGKLSEVGNAALESINKFAQYEDTFINLVTPANYDRFQIITSGFNVGKTGDMIQKELDEFKANKGKRDALGVDWGLKGDETKRSRISNIVRNTTGEYPTAGALGKYMLDYDRGITVSLGDTKQAERYLNNIITNEGINYQGMVIQGGQQLDIVTDFTFEQLMDGAQVATGNSASLLTPYLKALGVEGTPTSVKDVRGLDITATEDGFIIDSYEAQAPVRISQETMMLWGETLKQRNKFQQLRDEKKRQSEKDYRDLHSLMTL